MTLVNLAGRKLMQEDEKDPEQAKLAIDAVRALLPLCPEDQSVPIKDALSQLQMAYVRATQEPEEQPKPESKIWTPPGT